MAERIAEEKINQIRQSVDIVEIVSEYVQLKKQGRNYFGLCPFHGENSPSFSVSPDKQIFHCFGCGAGGNVFSFLMDIEGYSFLETAVILAEKGNIELSVDPSSLGKETKVSDDVQQILDAHDLLRKFYHHLLVNTKEGQHALEYLLDRGFSMESIKKFQIGYALNSWEFVSKFLQKRNFTPEILEKSGLIIKRESDGSSFDRFRDRIMFPIFDRHGKTIAFSGRSLGQDEPKYLNSPETAIFNKSKILYNFHLAKPSIRKTSHVILFEGFADVIAADRSSIENSVGTMGTSLTEDHVNQLKKIVQSVTICYDSDHAGIEAAFRAGTMLFGAGLLAKVALLPDGLDPDDYVKIYGTDKFRQEVMGSTLTWMAFKLRYFRRGKNLQDEGDRLRYIEEVLKEIRKLNNAVERDHYLRQIANEFSYSLDALNQQLGPISRSENGDLTQSKFPAKQTSVTTTKRVKSMLPAYQTAERRLLAHMIRNSDVAYQVQDLLKGNTLNIDEHQAIMTYLIGYYEEGNPPNPSDFLNYLKDETLKRIVVEIEMMSINLEITPQELNDYLKQVLNFHKMLKIKEMNAEKKEAEKQKDFLKAAAIGMEIIQLQKALK
ncbi:DNA primase [Bacillus sp. CGMCC 1.16607]|uniref:DNA primase n=1 Tax=Bacillus sp. CGMCC 1.16607 TaxID=3351842 RepID=UPI003644D82C